MKTNIFLKSSKTLLVLSLFFLLSYNSSFAQISVIVSRSSKQTLTKEDAKEIFSGSKTTWSNGNKAQVIDQSDTEVGSKFYNDFLSRSVNKVRLQWMRLVLSGQAIAPIKAADDEEMKKNVARDPNSVGYINSKSLDPSVKELFRIE